MQPHNTSSNKSSVSSEDKGKKKPRRIALTSVKSYYDCLAKGIIQNQTVKLFRAIHESTLPLTSRALSIKTDIERTSICRSLRNMEDAGIIEVAFETNCKITGRPVKHYRVKRIKSDQSEQEKGGSDA